jgi:hypothetical protein
MLRFACVVMVLSVLAGCGLPVPANATPCEREPSSQECQIWAYAHAGG